MNRRQRARKQLDMAEKQGRHSARVDIDTLGLLVVIAEGATVLQHVCRTLDLEKLPLSLALAIAALSTPVYTLEAEL